MCLELEDISISRGNEKVGVEREEILGDDGECGILRRGWS